MIERSDVTDAVSELPESDDDGSTGTQALSWSPGPLDPELPPYLALLAALEADIGAGALAAGTQLPPHRALAQHLGLSLSTVTKAYREAGVRGVVTGRIGQGTFVSAPSARHGGRGASGGAVNLGINLSPDVDQRAALRASFAELTRGAGRDGLFAYDAQGGLPEHRAGLAEWIATPGFRPATEQVFATNGAQHGLDLALAILARPGETILVEELTYVGFKALASLRGHRLEPVAMDAEGVVPEALEAAAAASGARIVYLMPTLHSPTGRTMGATRRRRIAEVIARADLHLIEDDVYGFLSEPKPEPIAGLAPERTLYLASLSKVFELGFRAGAMSVPAALVDRAQFALRATAWSATPMLFEAALRLARSGAMARILDDLRRECRQRVGLFRRFFPDAAGPAGAPAGYHVWLPLPAGWSAADLFFAARNDGVLLTPPGSASADGAPEPGLRLCLGAATGSADLERAMKVLRRLADRPLASMFSLA
ncbi:aminotransferase-like domain-containing protein [Ancylobacter terrae]|uniref:aminotransferase-like domain-containing protein n=1 Tax=Ancylobacter sp. sgz301288 TaxID=3342077 RepID=UPI00385D4480